MKRRVQSVRIGPSELRLLEAAAAREGIGWSTFMRQAALDSATEVLEREVDELRPSTSDGAPTRYEPPRETRSRE